MATDVKQIGELVREKSVFVRALFAEMDKVIIGQRYMLERMLIGLLANGHILLEGVPGLAKTMAVTTLSRAINADFKRIQFTPDLLPADLIGTQIYRQSDGAKRSDIRQHYFSRRDQPGPGEGPKRPVGSHAGKTGHHRQRDL